MPESFESRKLRWKFNLFPTGLEAIRSARSTGEPVDRTYNVALTGSDGVVHASVEKIIYLRRKAGS